MEQIIDLLSGMRDYTLATFLEDLLAARDAGTDMRCLKAFGQFRKFAYETVPSKYSLHEMFNRGRDTEPEPLKKWHIDSVSAAIQKEFRMLAKEEQFGAWRSSLLSGDSDLISQFTSMSTTLQTTAPTWLELLFRSGTGRSTLGREDAIRKISSDVVLPTCMVLRISRPRTCDGFTTCLGIFAYDAGLTANGLNLFSSLGICCSHRVVLSKLREAEHLAVENACKLGQSPTAVVSYDNFDFTEGRRGERVGDGIAFRSITNAMVAADRLQLVAPFSKTAWEPHKRLLRSLDVGINLGPNARIAEGVSHLWCMIPDILINIA